MWQGEDIMNRLNAEATIIGGAFDQTVDAWLDSIGLTGVVAREAKRQVVLESFNAAVEREKGRIRSRRTFWSRVFPWRITITRRT